MIDTACGTSLFIFCFHVFRPDGVNTVTIDEKERFEEIKERLRDFLANQITQFRSV